MSVLPLLSQSTLPPPRGLSSHRTSVHSSSRNNLHPTTPYSDDAQGPDYPSLLQLQIDEALLPACLGSKTPTGIPGDRISYNPTTGWVLG